MRKEVATSSKRPNSFHIMAARCNGNLECHIFDGWMVRRDGYGGMAVWQYDSTSSTLIYKVYITL